MTLYSYVERLKENGTQLKGTAREAYDFLKIVLLALVTTDQVVFSIQFTLYLTFRKQTAICCIFSFYLNLFCGYAKKVLYNFLFFIVLHLNLNLLICVLLQNAPGEVLVYMKVY